MVSASESAGVVHLITKEIRNPNGTKEKGIFVDEKLIYGKRTNADGYYYTVGEAVKRDGGIFIKPSESRVAPRNANGRALHILWFRPLQSAPAVSPFEEQTVPKQW